MWGWFKNQLQGQGISQRSICLMHINKYASKPTMSIRQCSPRPKGCITQTQCNKMTAMPPAPSKGHYWELRGEVGWRLHVWFNNIFTGTSSRKDHNKVLLWLYNCLKQAKFYISRKKFQPFVPVLDVLGSRMDEQGIHMQSDKMEKIWNWHEPKDHTGVLRFLGLIKYLLIFMLNVSDYTSPLQTICVNKQQFRWTPLHQKCFDEIKCLACRTPILKPIQWKCSPSRREPNSKFG
jgi:hypothetical protein